MQEISYKRRVQIPIGMEVEIGQTGGCYPRFGKTIMTAQTEYLWRLAIEVQKAEDLAAGSAEDSRERLIAEHMRELYLQIEQLPAQHDLFRHCRCAPGVAPPSATDKPALSSVPDGPNSSSDGSAGRA